MQPAITIIVPVYNTEKYLRECLESLVHQSFQNIEILLINDGSTDKSQNIIDEYSEKIYLCNRNNKRKWRKFLCKKFGTAACKR